MPKLEYEERVNALRFLCNDPPILKLLTFHVTIALQHCKLIRTLAGWNGRRLTLA